MSYSYTESATVSFTLTHAKHLASKVATDLKRIQRFYGSPSDEWIAAYEAEIIQYLKAGYLREVTYGFRREGQWIEPTLRYSAQELGEGALDDDPGRVRPNANVSGAAFHSYLTQNAAWSGLSSEQQATFKGTLPFQRSGAPEPTVNGYLQSDRTYSAGGRSLTRSSVRSS
jgi:hypothetical protein